MRAVGFDVVERTAVRGVVVTKDGKVLARSTGTLKSVARELGSSASSGPCGVAASGPDLGLKRDAIVCSPGAAAVTGEAWIGAARGARHAVSLHLGERIVAGVIADGKLLAGAHDMAGAAAWLTLNPVERQDYRKYGGLAAEVSDDAIARRLSWRIQAGDDSSVLERAGNLESITAGHVYEGARGGDGVSISVVRDTAKYIGMAIANLVVTVDPEVVVLDGVLAGAGDLILEPTRQECIRRLPPRMAELLRVELSTLDGYAIAIGAARLAMVSGR